jgi:hypothetical protein
MAKPAALFTNLPVFDFYPGGIVKWMRLIRFMRLIIMHS